MGYSGLFTDRKVDGDRVSVSVGFSIRLVMHSIQ